MDLVELTSIDLRLDFDWTKFSFSNLSSIAFDFLVLGLDFFSFKARKVNQVEVDVPLMLIKGWVHCRDLVCFSWTQFDSFYFRIKVEN